jgi:uncharacterized protein YbjT (DUF2867 family)
LIGGDTLDSDVSAYAYSSEYEALKGKMTTYLITGATGDIGSRVVTRLVQRGERPRVFVRDAEKARARYGDRVDVFVGDLEDPESFQAALGGAHALVNSGPSWRAAMRRQHKQRRPQA